MLVLISSVPHPAVKYTGFREDLTTYSKPYLLTCFFRGKDELTSHHPKPHLNHLAASDTFARLSAGPGWEHSTQLDLLVSLILERKWAECEWGRSARGAQHKVVQGPEQLPFSYLGFSFPFFLSLSNPTLEASLCTFSKRVKTASHSLLRAKVEMSCRGSGVYTGDWCGHRTSVLVSAFFASHGFPPSDLSDTFTHEDEHSVWVSGPGGPLQIIA